MDINSILITIARLGIYVCIIFNYNFTLAQTQDFTDTTYAVINALKDKDGSIRQEAIRMLGAIRPIKHEIVSILITALSDESEGVKSETVRVLGQIGPPAQRAVPVLLKALMDKTWDQTVRVDIPTALSKIVPGSPDIIAALTLIIEDKDDNLLTRAHAIMALGNMGSIAQHAVFALMQVAKEGEPELLRSKAWIALARIQPENEEAIQKLIEVAQGMFGREFSVTVGPRRDLFRVNIDALQTLVEIGKLEEAIPLLIQALEEEANTRVTAVVLLGKIGPTAKRALPSLLQILQEEPHTRDDLALKVVVLGSLEQIQSKSEEIISALKDIATHNPEPELRKVAEQVLEKLQTQN